MPISRSVMCCAMRACRRRRRRSATPRDRSIRGTPISARVPGRFWNWARPTARWISYISTVTAGLRERLLASGAARIINTASAAHQDAALDLDDLQSAKSFGPRKAYGRSKLCNILFTRELARRLRGTGVTANCLHPGFVATRFGDQSGGLLSRLVWLAKFFAISPPEGAETLVYLASSPAVAETTGQYFYKCRATAPSLAAQDDQLAQSLWQRSAALAGMKE